MIETLMYRDRVIEITVMSDAINDEWVLECWDLTPADGGQLFTLARNGDGVIEVRPLGRPIPVDLLERVIAIAADELPEEGDEGEVV